MGSSSKGSLSSRLLIAPVTVWWLALLGLRGRRRREGEHGLRPERRPGGVAAAGGSTAIGGDLGPGCSVVPSNHLSGRSRSKRSIACWLTECPSPPWWWTLATTPPRTCQALDRLRAH